MNIVALTCHIMSYNENNNQIINYEFCEKLKLLFCVIVNYLVCQLFLGVVGNKMDGLTLIAIILIIVIQLFDKYGSYSTIFNDNIGYIYCIDMGYYNEF